MADIVYKLGSPVRKVANKLYGKTFSTTSTSTAPECSRTANGPHDLLPPPTASHTANELRGVSLGRRAWSAAQVSPAMRAHRSEFSAMDYYNWPK